LPLDAENTGRQIRLDAGVPATILPDNPVDGFRGQLYCQHAAVEHVLPKDSGKALPDDQVDSVDFESPRRMLP